MTEGIEFLDPISIELKQKAVATITTTLKEIASEPQARKSFVLEKSVKEYKQVIRHLMEELRDESRLNVDSIRCMCT